jgi:hypothetical protein
LCNNCVPLASGSSPASADRSLSICGRRPSNTQAHSDARRAKEEKEENRKLARRISYFMQLNFAAKVFRRLEDTRPRASCSVCAKSIYTSNVGTVPVRGRQHRKKAVGERRRRNFCAGSAVCKVFAALGRMCERASWSVIIMSASTSSSSAALAHSASAASSPAGRKSHRGWSPGNNCLVTPAPRMSWGRTRASSAREATSGNFSGCAAQAHANRSNISRQASEFKFNAHKFAISRANKRESFQIAG